MSPRRQLQKHSCDGECGRVGTWPRNIDRLYLCPACALRYAAMP